MSTDDVDTVETTQGTMGAIPVGALPVRYRVAAIGAWALVFALWTTTRHFPYLSGLLFVLLGASALLLTTIGARGWCGSILRTAPFGEAAARAAWTTGAAGTIVFFENVLLSRSQGLADAANRLALSFLPSVYGCALATALLALTLRASAADGPAPLRGNLAGSAWDLWLGRTFFASLVAWPLLQAASNGGARVAESVGMLHWPAVLVLLGVVVAIRLLGGAAVRERAATAALAGGGTVTALAGLVQALSGIAGANLAAVSAGISFLVTACLATLLGLALVTFPHDDRIADDGRLLAARVAWVLFPLVTVALMAITFLMILTPMTRKV
jgi:hypothetical protein